MNDDEIKKVITKEADRVSGVFGVVGMAVIVVAICSTVVGVCWAGAWMLVHL